MSYSNCTSLGDLEFEGHLQPQKDHHLSWYKPVVSTDEGSTGGARVLKRYPRARFPIRLYFHLLARHEYKMLRLVEGHPFAPKGVALVPGESGGVSYRYVPGIPVKDLGERKCIPEGFFQRLYSSVLAMHKHGVVHLDLGNSGNILANEAGEPVIIDFGSALTLARVPGIFRSWMRKKDLLGVLKLWQRFDAESMPAVLSEYFQRNYRKNIYTPKRFYKAVKNRFFNNGVRRDEGDADGLSDMLGIFALFFGLMALISLW